MPLLMSIRARAAGKICRDMGVVSLADGGFLATSEISNKAATVNGTLA